MENKNYTVYMHICPNGKRYIGITKLKPQERWGNGKSYKGCISPRRKKVLCIETNTIYESLMIAGKETNISIGHISQCCNNTYGRKTAGGYHWQYYDLDKIESEDK